jgi:hypothetical protein
MDRQAFTTGQLVPNTQLLGMEKGKLIALGYAMDATFGAGPVVSGLACTQTASPSLSVVVGPGSIMTKTAIDSTTAYSDLGTDTNATVKQGILQEPGATLTLTAPSTAGYSQVYLIQATQSDVDVTTTVPFYNAANPAVPYNGPSNSGNATLTLRQSKCVVSLKAGAAATTGSQTAPSPDAGNVGLYTITLVNGQSTITTGQISVYPGAPFVPDTLPGIPAAIQKGKYTSYNATGTANALVITPTPALAAYGFGASFTVVPSATNTSASVTLNVSGLGARTILKQDGTQPAIGDIRQGVPLRVFDNGTNYLVHGSLPSDVVLPGNLTATQRMAVFLSSGTYTIKSSAIKVTLVGGGGGGNNTYGGGAGAELIGYVTGLTIGNTLAVTIGAGGTGFVGTGSAGSPGGSTTLDSGTQSITTLTAGGGNGSPGGSGGTGGTATGGQINSVGNGGGTGIGGIAAPNPPFGNGGGTAGNGITVNGSMVINNNGVQGIAIIEAVA